MEINSFGHDFAHRPWYPAASALTRVRYVTNLWRPSPATILLPWFSLSGTVKLFATPWTSMSFHIFLLLPTLILLAGIPLWKLCTIPIHLAWSGSHISPGSLPLSASLQGKVVHSFFWVYIISLHTIFIVFMILYSSMYPLTYKNNKLWLWVRHWDKCREHNGEKDTGSFWPLFSYNLHPIVITYDSHISSSDSREGRKPSLLIFYFPLLIPSTGIQ